MPLYLFPIDSCKTVKNYFLIFFLHFPKIRKTSYSPYLMYIRNIKNIFQSCIRIIINQGNSFSPPYLPNSLFFHSIFLWKHRLLHPVFERRLKAGLWMDTYKVLKLYSDNFFSFLRFVPCLLMWLLPDQKSYRIFSW